MLANYRMKGHELVWFSPSPPSIACFLFLVFGFRMYIHDIRSLVDKYRLLVVNGILSLTSLPLIHTYSLLLLQGRISTVILLLEKTLLDIIDSSAT